jgi:hypothetical protein
MNRKNFIRNIGMGLIGGGGTLFLSSCDDFLKEKPKSITNPDTFFNSDSAVKAAVNGLYKLYHNNSLWGKIGLDRFYENGADTMGPSRLFDQVGPIQDYTMDAGNMDKISQGGGAPETWQDLYKVIQNSNLILEKIKGNKNISDDAKTLYGGEALFLRAYTYYNLTNLWGAVPYYRKSMPIDQVRTLGRTDRDKIRSDILKDLQQAQDQLPDSYSGNELGHVSKWVAATVMAKIYLWQKEWKKARDKAVEIINKSPHGLLNKYADIFKPDNEYNKEIIWTIDFVKDKNPNDWPNHFIPRLRDEPENGSERDALEKALEARNEGFTGYGLSVPIPDLVDKYPKGDLRRSSNVITNYLGFELHFPYFKKFWYLDQTKSPRSNHGNNKIIFRLADVYLMAAEAENELNGPANAYQYINKVRERAYDPSQPLSGLSQQQFRKAIYDERKWELAAENHRRMDLIRWGILLKVVKNAKYLVYHPADHITPKNVLLPIPATQLQLNPNLLKLDPTNNGYRS